ncbi:copper transporter [Nonomuraea rhizosphaerae]|uniref:copper transporter n=1 Tax=Nonomuraea rhizosphaerae TaxID=2665663 RepID=UPI001C5E1DD6|nr:copper transporter [Nonomuraea rhizosphaerae]
MIDFRYHLVSIVAIFLALAVGIVMGTTLLQSPAIEVARRTSNEMIKANADYRAQIDSLRGREDGNDAYISGLTPQLVAGELTGQHVVLIEAPGSSTSYREAGQQVLEQAGAMVTGRVLLTDKFVDVKQQGVIDGLATQLKPEGLPYPVEAGPYEKAATLLAATLVTRDEGQASTANPTTDGVLTGFEEGGFLSIEEDPSKRATLAVMFAPEKPYEGENAEAQAGALVSLAGGLDAGSKGVVMTGGATTAAAPGGVISALRDNSEVAKQVSSVDTPDMPAGLVVIVEALREQLAGRAGQYGIGPGATLFHPPSPSATPSPTPSGS